MELVLSVAIVCGTIIYLARTLGAPSFTILIAPKAGEAVAQEPETPAVPQQILFYCAAESEPFARQALLRKAHMLYAEHKDWDKVYSLLQSAEGRDD